MVDLPPDFVWGTQVRRWAALDGSESVHQGLLDVGGGGGLCALDFAVGFCHQTGEPLHLGCEQVLRDGAGVVGLQELLAHGVGLLLLSNGASEVVAGLALLMRLLGATVAWM